MREGPPEIPSRVVPSEVGPQVRDSGKRIDQARAAGAPDATIAARVEGEGKFSPEPAAKVSAIQRMFTLLRGKSRARQQDPQT